MLNETELCREHGLSNAMLYKWHTKYCEMVA
ncbi:transposase [uncultured Desulfuromusa sp.]